MLRLVLIIDLTLDSSYLFMSTRQGPLIALVNHGLSIPFFLLQNFYPLSSAIPFDTPVTGILWTPWSLEWICQSNFLKGVAVPHVTKNQIVTYKQHLLIFFVLFWRWLASKDHNQGQPAVCGFVATFAFNPNLCHFCHTCISKVHFDLTWQNSLYVTKAYLDDDDDDADIDGHEHLIQSAGLPCGRTHFE